MSKSIYERNFEKLEAVVPSIWTINETLRLKSSGFMDLSIEILERLDSGCVRVSLTHYGEQNGDLMADPDMEIMVSPHTRCIEALSFRNDYVGVYQVVYPEKGKVVPRYKKEQNEFLGQWLDNLAMQGFRHDMLSAIPSA